METEIEVLRSITGCADSTHAFALLRRVGWDVKYFLTPVIPASIHGVRIGPEHRVRILNERGVSVVDCTDRPLADVAEYALRQMGVQ